MNAELLDDYDIKEIEETTSKLKNDGFNWDRFTRVVVALRWVINTVLIGIPWFAISLALVAYNIVFNAWLNKGWGYGNIWLVSNTVFAIF